MSTWNPGGVILGEYLIEKELGYGGMGRVWLVKSNSTGRRFAVKQALIRDEHNRKAFLTELQTWIDLPEHPNIVPCRFFRTVGDEIVIFADYIEGGSLADWIAKGKLTSLEQILDVAIQFAWGLHAIHERGFIHQDVKPGNVLMMPNRVPMVADFGLARARIMVEEPASILEPTLLGQQSSSVRGTAQYESPEQRSGKPLTLKTDIWSWGVSVLDMVIGGVSCPYGGHMAAEILQLIADSPEKSNQFLPIPDTLQDTLAKCFAKSCNDRWATIVDACSGLAVLFTDITGHPHAPFPGESSSAPNNFARSIGAVAWTNPRECIRQVVSIFGSERDEEEMSSLLNADGLAADIGLFEFAAKLVNNALHSGRKDLFLILATIFIQKGHVHEKAGDKNGALASYDAAIKCLGYPGGQGNDEVLTLLAQAYEERGSVSSPQESIEWYDKAIAILGPMMSRRLTDNDCLARYAHALERKGKALMLLGDENIALEEIERAISFYNLVPSQIMSSDTANGLATAYTNKASLLSKKQNYSSALIVAEAAIQIRRTLINQGEYQYLSSFAASLNNKGSALFAQGNLYDAIETWAEATQVLGEAIKRGEQRTGFLAGIYENIAIALMNLEDMKAVAVFDHAINLYRQAIDDEGDLHCVPGLEKAQMLRELCV